jgi:hypothetical protein
MDVVRGGSDAQKWECVGMIDSKRINQLEVGERRIMKHKYGDLFLLCSVVMAFGTLLVLSIIG